jgi:hypothetical protein
MLKIITIEAILHFISKLYSSFNNCQGCGAYKYPEQYALQYRAPSYRAQCSE